jgi:hypothetical protein
MTRLDQLRSLANQLGIAAEDLDELVHDAKSAEAASINNQGLGEQIAYLAECYSADDLEDRLRELKTEPRRQFGT